VRGNNIERLQLQDDKESKREIYFFNKNFKGGLT
jgi:hypothetical protein